MVITDRVVRFDNRQMLVAQAAQARITRRGIGEPKLTCLSSSLRREMEMSRVEMLQVTDIIGYRKT